MASEKPIKYSRVPFPHFTERHVPQHGDNISKLQRVKVEIAVELGKTRMTLADMLGLKPVSEETELNEMGEGQREKYIVKLERQIGEPVDLLINGRIFAKGEVVSSTAGTPYGVRVISVMSQEQRIEEQSKRK